MAHPEPYGEFPTRGRFALVASSSARTSSKISSKKVFIAKLSEHLRVDGSNGWLARRLLTWAATLNHPRGVFARDRGRIKRHDFRGFIGMDGSQPRF